MSNQSVTEILEAHGRQLRARQLLQENPYTHTLYRDLSVYLDSSLVISDEADGDSYRSSRYTTHPDPESVFSPDDARAISSAVRTLEPQRHATSAGSFPTTTASSSYTAISSVFDEAASTPRFAPHVPESAVPEIEQDSDDHDADGHADGVLWCEFASLIGCPVRYRATMCGIQDWIEHHLRRHYPPNCLPLRFSCWFCPRTYTCDEDPDTKRHWQTWYKTRMAHIATHVTHDQKGWHDRRRDIDVINHARSMGLIGDEAFRNAMPNPGGVTLVPLSSPRTSVEAASAIVNSNSGRRARRRRQHVQ